MYINTYDEKPRLKAEMDLPKAIAAIVCVLLFFVIPAQVITVYKAKGDLNISTTVSASDSLNATNNGRVAGVYATTEKTEASLFSNLTSIDLTTPAGKYTAVGLFFGSISILLLGYMIHDHKQFKKAQRRQYL